MLDAYLRERRDIIETAAAMGRKLTDQEQERLADLFSERIDGYLDRGEGACHLQRPDVGDMVCGALTYYHTVRYDIHTWCVMPNHVHLLFTPLGSHTLASIMNNLKSFTAHEANRMLGRRGVFWMPEYFDHMIRHRGDFDRSRQYILDNPAKARLKEWPWVGYPVSWAYPKGL
ncbi:MAG TPA: transposase [Phycisphaerae bacterium]|nr:transposase [Phycisphaerae bacterium]